MSNRYFVKCVETGVTYDSLKKACEKTGTDNKTLRNAMKRPELKAKGFHWQMVEIDKQFQRDLKRKATRKKKGKTVPVFTGHYPGEESTLKSYGDFYHDKYRLFVQKTGEKYYKLKVVLNPPAKDRKANFYLQITLNKDGAKIWKGKVSLILKNQYPQVYKALQKHIEEVI